MLTITDINTKMFCLLILFEVEKVNNYLIKRYIVCALPATVHKREQMETKCLALIG